jgi:hypothetical protein
MPLYQLTTDNKPVNRYRIILIQITLADWTSQQKSASELQLLSEGRKSRSE